MGICDLSNLLQLNLQNNELSGNLPPVYLPRLRYLDLSSNKITSLAAFSKSTLPSLLQLDIQRNLLEELPTLNCESLETYSFSWNKIKTM
jgi:Leucine-rich repeat (LRR) protein